MYSDLQTTTRNAADEKKKKRRELAFKLQPEIRRIKTKSEVGQIELARAGT